MTLNTIVSNISPAITHDLQNDGLIKLKMSLNDNAKSYFDKFLKEVANYDDYVSIERDDILFTNPKNPAFLCNDSVITKDFIEWKSIFTEKYYVKYLDMASRYYEDFYFEDNYFQRIFPKIQSNLKRPYYYHLKNIFHIFVNYFYNFIKKNDIKLFIQHITPHEPNIWLIHCICKELGVRTLFLHNIFINKKSYHLLMEDIKDIGLYKTAVVVNKNKLDIKIRNSHRIELIDREVDLKKNSLMKEGKIKGIPFVQKDRHNFLKKQIAEYRSSFLLRKLPWNWSSLKKDYGYINIRNKVEYYENLQEVVVNDFDLESKFVYFPLHWQPELTTMPLGFEYQDQLLAIEHLSSILPRGWKIVTKEHLSQTGAMRDKAWFERFRSIEGVEMLDYEFDTYTLIEKSQIVATITGTAGFEAVIGGKPSIVFGAAWYAGCDGVFQFKSDLNLQEISSYKINHGKIQNFIDDLSLKLSDIQIDLTYYPGVIDDNFYARNDEKFLTSLKRALSNNGRYLDEILYPKDPEGSSSQPSSDITSEQIAHRMIKKKGLFIFIGKVLASFCPDRELRKRIRKYFAKLS